MSSLSAELGASIRKIVNSYAVKISENFNLNIDDVLKVFNEASVEPKKTTIKVESSSLSENKNGGVCDYTFTRGKVKGTKCGKTNCKEKSHTKVKEVKEKKEPIEKKPHIDVSQSIVRKLNDLSINSTGTVELKKGVNVPLNKSNKTVDGKNVIELNNTLFLFNNTTNKVTGVYDPSIKKERDLYTEDIDLCKQYQLRYVEPKTLTRGSKVEVTEEKLEEEEEVEYEEVEVTDEDEEEEEEVVSE